jgi:hypothetical protein
MPAKTRGPRLIALRLLSGLICRGGRIEREAWRHFHVLVSIIARSAIKPSIVQKASKPQNQTRQRHTGDAEHEDGCRGRIEQELFEFYEHRT